ncbi:signal recognition particle-docking protein FtsY [Ottowia sp.]|uniref:signal recognition particle-docking protein FtsY n=1 Tax=Ottowia sp. TaxID=1898956 RepID=UPI003A86877A
MFSFFRRKKNSEPAPEAVNPPPPLPSDSTPAARTDEAPDALPAWSDDELAAQALAAAPEASPPPEKAIKTIASNEESVSDYIALNSEVSVVMPAEVGTAPAASKATEAPERPAPTVTPEHIEPAHAEPEHTAPEHIESPSRSGWLGKLTTGLRRTGSSITTVFTGAKIDEALYEDLETALLLADTGVAATEFLLHDLRRRVKDQRASQPAQVKTLLQDAIADMLAPLEQTLQVGVYHPTVIMVAGVNGAGKTTSIGKLTKHLADAGASVLLAAADTFRAAAREQLAVWADRNQVEIISQQGADPSAVSFDAVAAGRARSKDVVLIDTAGRLPTQKHLMEELTKIRRVVTKADFTAPHEVLLVIDGNTGQNALAQVKAFDESAQLTGLIVTKLDGTAKGGVLCAIAREYASRKQPLAVYFVGVGEKLEDLQTFKAREFAQALVG